MNHLKILLLIFIFYSTQTYSQKFYRVKANITIKDKNSDGKYNLTKGILYYDINYRKAVYNISFPENAMIVIADTVSYTIKEGKKTKSKSLKEFLDFSLFNLCLTGKLDYYGLKDTPFTISKTEKQDSLVITTWSPPQKLRKKKGVIKVSVKNKKLFGVIIYDVKGNIISKQFFEDYIVVKNLTIPTKIVSFSYIKGKTFTQITEFKNITINEEGNDSFYNYSVN